MVPWARTGVLEALCTNRSWMISFSDFSLPNSKPTSLNTVWWTPFFVPTLVRWELGEVNLWSRGKAGWSRSWVNLIHAGQVASLVSLCCLCTSDRVPAVVKLSRGQWCLCHVFSWIQVLISCLHIWIYSISVFFGGTFNQKNKGSIKSLVFGVFLRVETFYKVQCFLSIIFVEAKLRSLSSECLSG